MVDGENDPGQYLGQLESAMMTFLLMAGCVNVQHSEFQGESPQWIDMDIHELTIPNVFFFQGTPSTFTLFPGLQEKLVCLGPFGAFGAYFTAGYVLHAMI